MKKQKEERTNVLFTIWAISLIAIAHFYSKVLTVGEGREGYIYSVLLIIAISVMFSCLRGVIELGLFDGCDPEELTGKLAELHSSGDYLLMVLRAGRYDEDGFWEHYSDLTSYYGHSCYLVNDPNPHDPKQYIISDKHPQLLGETALVSIARIVK